MGSGFECSGVVRGGEGGVGEVSGGTRSCCCCACLSWLIVLFELIG